MGFFSGLNAESYDRTYRDRDLVWRMLVYFKPYRARLVWAFVGILVIAAAGALSPILVSRSVDLMAGRESTTLMLVFAAALFATGVLVWGANWIRRRLITRAVADVMLALQQRPWPRGSGCQVAHHRSVSPDYAAPPVSRGHEVS